MCNATTTAALAAKAEKVLGIDIGITPSGRAWHYAEETRQAYWLTRADLRLAIEREWDDDEDIYSLWCQSTGREMPESTRDRLLGR